MKYIKTPHKTRQILWKHQSVYVHAMIRKKMKKSLMWVVMLFSAKIQFICPDMEGGKSQVLTNKKIEWYLKGQSEIILLYKAR